MRPSHPTLILSFCGACLRISTREEFSHLPETRELGGDNADTLAGQRNPTRTAVSTLHSPELYFVIYASCSFFFFFFRFFS